MTTVSSPPMWLSANDLRAAREVAFSQTMDLVFERHPFYRGRFLELGLSRNDFQSMSDLNLLPITFKKDFMEGPERFVLESQGMSNEMHTVWDTMYTTGSTSGHPTPFVSTSFDFFNILQLQRNMLTLRGVSQNDLIANLFPITTAPHGAWIRVLHAASSLHVPVFCAMPGKPSEHFKVGSGLDEVVHMLAIQRPTVLWGVPSYVHKMVLRAKVLNIELSSVRMVFVTGEALGESGRQDMLSALKQVGANHAQISISYGSTEMQGGMVECSSGSGYHNPLPTHLLIDIVDPATHLPVPDGEEGLVILTHLQRTGTLLLRYALGDISVRTQVPCPHCGVVTDRLIQTPRRSDNQVKIKGMLINPEPLINTMDECMGATPFQFQVNLVNESNSLSGDVLKLVVQQPLATAIEIAQWIQNVKDACGVTPIVQLVSDPQSMQGHGNWKTKKFFDLR